MTLQVDFANTQVISSDLLEPDSLRVTLLKPELFIDVETGEPVNIELEINPTLIVPQYTTAEIVELEETAEEVSVIAYVYTILEILLLFFLQKAIFSLWNLILTLQFLTFIAVWQIRYPPITRFILFKLRVITRGEFLDDLDFGQIIASALSIETNSEKITDESVGEERLGQQSVLANFGPTLIILSIIFAIIICVVVLLIFCRKHEI